MFAEGLAAVKENGKWGYINTSGDTGEIWLYLSKDGMGLFTVPYVGPPMDEQNVSMRLRTAIPCFFRYMAKSIVQDIRFWKMTLPFCWILATMIITWA